MSTNREIKLHMKKGDAILKETQEIPLKENCLLHTDRYTFFCNSTTFDRIAKMNYLGRTDAEEANRQLEEFFLKEATAGNVTGLCQDYNRGPISDLKIVKN